VAVSGTRQLVRPDRVLSFEVHLYVRKQTGGPFSHFSNFYFISSCVSKISKFQKRIEPRTGMETHVEIPQTSEAERAEINLSTAFTKFLELPDELQLLIWKVVSFHSRTFCLTQYVHAESDGNRDEIEQGCAGISGLLQVCKLTRTEALSLYTKISQLAPSKKENALQSWIPLIAGTPGPQMSLKRYINTAVDKLRIEVCPRQFFFGGMYSLRLEDIVRFQHFLSLSRLTLSLDWT